MTIQITAVRYSGYSKTHEAISDLRWVGVQTHQTSTITKSALVAWLDESTSNEAIVSDGRRSAQVGTVHPQYTQAYVRTYADGVWTDNLLALPVF